MFGGGVVMLWYSVIGVWRGEVLVWRGGEENGGVCGGKYNCSELISL